MLSLNIIIFLMDLIDICMFSNMAKPLEFRPHSYFVDFTSRAPFYIMTSLPAFIKVGKTPATQNLVLITNREKQINVA
jgi:hypothetical protein